jgi:antitoxin YefM
MSRVTHSELRQNLARYLDEVVESRAPIVVTRPGGKGNVVMLSEDEFTGWQETVHLLANPVNAERLLRSIRAADAGATRERRMAKPKAAPAR